MKTRRKPTHPGIVFREDYVKAKGLTTCLVANMLNIGVCDMRRFMNGHISVTVELAVQLAELTGTSSNSWINMQLRYDAWEADNV